MSSAIAHRGPEDSGFYQRQFGTHTVGLVHRRLRIIDLSPAGHQPMLDASGRWAISFNGEIYNFKELRRELEERGTRFRTQGDGEVIQGRWTD